jgi:pyruvate-formate lyase-activating enzyme
LIEQRTAASSAHTENVSIRYELLTFHRMASDKYRSLDMEYKAASLEPLQKTRMQELARVAVRLGVETTVR